MNITGNGQILAEEGLSGLTAYHAYVYTPATNSWNDLGTPNAGPIVSAALNDNGQVVAAMKDQLFLYSNGKWNGIGTPPGLPDIAPRAFNDAGQVLVNASVTATSPSQPFLFSNDQWINLNTLLPAGSTVTLVGAGALNRQNGQIVATGADGHAYLLTPLPPAPPPPSGSPGGGNVGVTSPPVLKIPPLLASIDALLGGVEVLNPNDTETITDSFFGIALLVSTFDHSGNLESVDLFGFINITFLFV